ncbi:MAG: polysaccharide deacetylase [Chloroflexaceae bacterium]|jgi:hypothetical protein|nr:polysaccharide deacetylase [Chloroflexaceae bacterium]
MVSRRLLLVATIFCLLVGALGVALFVQQRVGECRAVPLLAENLLPNADLSQPGENPRMPQGWRGRAGGVELGQFAIDGDRRSMQLLGIANYVQTPAIAVQAGRSYCFSGFAITDNDKGSTTRLRLSFDWRDDANQPLGEAATPWQPVSLWREGDAGAAWAPVNGAFVAPPGATSLLVRLSPSSDDRIYLDGMAVRAGGNPVETAYMPSLPPNMPTLEPWPDGNRAAVAFTFDWETTMAGLIHSRSAGDPNSDGDPVQRGLRMREGVTTTLEIFRPHGIRATYYAAGYNFLLDNLAGRRFMGDPVFAWANTTNRWNTDRWTTTPWFADDPYGSYKTDPAWYFGDLIPILQRERQDIQSHTFSHFYGGFVNAQEWQSDIAAWNEVAAERGVPPLRSIAFPWSSSGGMSDASWEVLAAAGVRSVTRLSDQSQYNFFERDANGIVNEPHCRPLPGHEQILACPDFYLTVASAERAIAQVQRAQAVGGMIDLWAHTEEVVTPEQIAAWTRVVDFVAGQPDIWVAPLPELADWQAALSQVRIEQVEAAAPDTGQPTRFTLVNGSNRTLEGVTLRLPFAVTRLVLNGDELSPANLPLVDPQRLRLTLQAGERLEVQVWP